MTLPDFPAWALLGRITVAVLTLFAAGWLTALIAIKEDADERPMARLLVALAWGFGIVPTWAFFAHLLTGAAVTFPALLSAASAQLIASAVIVARQGRLHRSAIVADLRALAGYKWPLLTASAIGFFFYIKHDGSVPSGSCVTQAAAVAAAWDPSGFDLLRGNLGDNRLGNAGVLAGAMAAFGQLAFRALYSLLAVLLALGGWMLGATVCKRRWAGWLGLLVTPLNPYVASLPLIDENLLTLAFSVSFLPLCFGAARWWAIGALYGLCATMRHPLGLAAPALLLCAWSGGRWRAVAQFVVGGVALTALEHAHHMLAFGSVLQFESNAYFMPQDYQLFGQRFRWKGMLNWPLHDRLVRTPHNPFPTMMMWPLALADHFGLVLFGAICSGFFAVWRRRRHALLWLLWFAPVMASLMVQEAWDYPNKMGVILIAFGPVVAWLIEGVAAAVRAPRQGGAAWALMVVAAALAVSAAKGVRAPTDSRYFAHYQLPAQESQTWLSMVRRQATDVALWPDFGRMAQYGAVLNSAKLADLGHEHQTSHSWGWFSDETPPAGAPTVLQIDLRAAPWGRDDFVRLAPPGVPADIDLVERPERWVAANIPLPWERHRGWLTAIRGRHLSVLELGFVAREPERCDPDTDQRACRFYKTFAAQLERRANAAARVVAVKEPIVYVRVPSGGASFIVSINERGNVLQMWKLRVSERGVSAQQPRAFWHN